MAEWGKLYGSLHDDPKWRSLTKGARALWTTANSWCIDHHKTNGHVPAGMLPGLDGTRSDVARLVLAGLWHDAGHSCERCPQIEDGWQFHDWTEHQRSSDQVESDREAQAERQRRARERRESRRDAAVTHEGVTLLEESRGEERREETPNGVSGAAADADGFDTFWAAYPRRDDRGHALKAYRSALRKTDAATLAKAAASFAEQCAHEKRERRFTPLASTWLNGERWNDEHHVAPPTGADPPGDREPNITELRLAGLL